MTKVLEQYLLALDQGDIAGMARVADVPFVDSQRQLIRDRAQLPGVLAQVSKQLPQQPNVKRHISSVRYGAIREQIEDEVTRQLCADVLDDDDWIVSISTDPFTQRTILIRVNQDRAAVIAGPLKPNQFGTPNRIPEPAYSLLEQAEGFEAFSLHPVRPGTQPPGPPAVDPFGDSSLLDSVPPRAPKPQPEVPAEPKPAFHGWTILKQVTITNAEERQRLIQLLRQATEDNPGSYALCFNPRHGLRLTRGKRVVDLVICFECSQVEVYVDDKRGVGFLTTNLPQEAFNSSLGR